MIEGIAVVIPARNEEALLGACLRSVRIAADAVRRDRPGLDVRTVVALDCCTDRSGEVAAAVGVEQVVLQAGAVGAARRAGVAHVETQNPWAPERTWIACTDADTVVSSDWLVDQVELAELDYDLVVGCVRPDPRDLSERVVAAWTTRHPPTGEHVFGANLGFRLSTHRQAGGFQELFEHEDVALIRDIKAAGCRWATGSVVTTSARLTGRTPGGFAGYLRALTHELEP